MLVNMADSIAILGEALAAAYSSTAVEIRRFEIEHGAEPNLMLKAHTFLNLAQLEAEASTPFRIDPSWREFGRVRFVSTVANQSYLLRKESRVQLDQSLGRSEGQLFALGPYIQPDEQLLTYEFGPEGLDLRTVAAIRRGARYISIDEPSETVRVEYLGGEETFDQGDADPFDDLGDIDLDDESEGRE